MLLTLTKLSLFFLLMKHVLINSRKRFLKMWLLSILLHLLHPRLHLPLNPLSHKPLLMLLLVQITPPLTLILLPILVQIVVEEVDLAEVVVEEADFLMSSAKSVLGLDIQLLHASTGLTNSFSHKFHLISKVFRDSIMLLLIFIILHLLV